jgi:hypothetical protein
MEELFTDLPSIVQLTVAAVGIAILVRSWGRD